MRVTNIRKNGIRLTREQLELVQLKLKVEFENHGFLSDCEIRQAKRYTKKSDPTDARTIIKAIRASQKPPKPEKPVPLFLHVGRNWSSFRIDTKRLGHNARINPYYKTISGYKRTDVPTWNQRVKFNDLINDVLDSFGLTASIKSGCFTVRNSTGRKTENDWLNDSQNASGFHSTADSGIMPESEARTECNSDERERLAREERNRLARQKRAERKAGLQS